MAWMVRITADPGAADLVTSLLWDVGTTGIAEDGNELIAGFADRPSADRAVAAAEGWPARVVALEPVAWTGSSEVTTVVVDLQPGLDRSFSLSISAGPTFGHGGHPTTALAIDLVVETALAAPDGCSVLDVGTGSGVLAIAAATVGAEPVVGIDIDPAAVPVAEANARANGVVIRASTDDVTTAGDRVGVAGFDLVVANVLLPVQRELAAELASVLSPAGTLVTAGYLIDDGAELEALHRAALGSRAEGMTIDRRRRDGWLAHRFRLARR